MKKCINKSKLGWCERCKENSVRVKVYKDGKRAEICVNDGHGFIRYLPKLEEKNV